MVILLAEFAADRLASVAAAARIPRYRRLLRTIVLILNQRGEALAVISPVKPATCGVHRHARTENRCRQGNPFDVVAGPLQYRYSPVSPIGSGRHQRMCAIIFVKLRFDRQCSLRRGNQPAPCDAGPAEANDSRRRRGDRRLAGSDSSRQATFLGRSAGNRSAAIKINSRTESGGIGLSNRLGSGASDRQGSHVNKLRARHPFAAQFPAARKARMRRRRTRQQNHARRHQTSDRYCEQQFTRIGHRLPVVERSAAK